MFSVLFVTVWFYAFLFVEVNYNKVLPIHRAISLGHESKTDCTNPIIFAFEMTVLISPTVLNVENVRRFVRSLRSRVDV